MAHTGCLGVASEAATGQDDSPHEGCRTRCLGGASEAVLAGETRRLRTAVRGDKAALQRRGLGRGDSARGPHRRLRERAASAFGPEALRGTGREAPSTNIHCSALLIIIKETGHPVWLWTADFPGSETARARQMVAGPPPFVSCSLSPRQLHHLFH